MEEKYDASEKPKKFCENISIAYAKEYFVLKMLYHEDLYGLTPQHAKRLSQYLAYQVSKYEGMFGVIQSTWSEPDKSENKSPLQPTDL